LFHSFGEFNVPTNTTANFLNNAGLPTSNILGRIIGGGRTARSRLIVSFNHSKATTSVCSRALLRALIGLADDLDALHFGADGPCIVS
jgi:hypothetical protein